MADIKISQLPLASDVVGGEHIPINQGGETKKISPGNMLLQNKNAVSITGGIISGITDLAIADGGTGASTILDARNNLNVYSKTEIDGFVTTLSNTDATINSTISSLNTTYAPINNPNFTTNARLNGEDLGYKDVLQNPQSGNYTLALTDRSKHIYSTNTSNQTITVPPNATVAFPVGTTITIINNGTNAITFTTTGLTVYKAGTSIAWASGGTMAIRGMCSFTKVALDTWFITGVGLS